MLASYCAGLGADVLGLQEVDVRLARSGWADQALATARAAGMAHVFGPARRMGVVGRYGNALLTPGEIDEVQLLVLPGGAGREPRAAILATVARSHLRLSVAATHLSTSREEALGQLEAVVEALGSRPAPRVLLGDLNLASSAVQPVVEAAGLGLVDTDCPTYPAHAARSRIDHIAVAGLAPAAVTVLPPAPVSDHRALAADLLAP